MLRRHGSSKIAALVTHNNRRCSSSSSGVIVETKRKDNFFLSTLSNGLRVLTVNDGSGCTGAGVFTLNATKFETESTRGAAAILESLPLRGNAIHSQEDVCQLLGTLGNAYKTTNNKEAMGTMIMTPRYHAQEGLEILNGMCLQPSHDPKVFREAKEMTRERASVADRDATKVCFELIHQAAWGGKGLGNDTFPSDDQLDELTLDNFLAFHRVHTRPSRTVVAATGVADHEAYAKMCFETLQFPEPQPGDDALLAASHTAASRATYCGGSVLRHNTKAPDSTKKFAERNLSHAGLMFQGVPLHHPDYYTVALIQSLLGGGTSFSSGGPGKGMQTKLFREVLHREGWIHGVECISAWYSDGGIIGLYASAPHEWVRHLVNMMMIQACSICQRIGEEHIDMAKNQLCSQLVLLGEGREQLLSDMGFNLIVHNYITTADEILRGTSSVTLKDLKRVCATMIERPITFALFGDTEKMPTHDVLERQMKALYAKMNVE